MLISVCSPISTMQRAFVVDMGKQFPFRARRESHIFTMRSLVFVNTMGIILYLYHGINKMYEKPRQGRIFFTFFYCINLLKFIT